MNSIAKRIKSKLVSLGKAALRQASKLQNPPPQAPFNKNTYWTTSNAACAYSSSVDFSDSYDTYLIQRFHSIVERYVPKGLDIMDAGSGTGVLTQKLTKEGYKLTAIDISSEMQKYSIDQTPAANHIAASIFDLPSDLQSFDAVVSRWFIPHFKNWPKVIEILGSHLKTNGYLIFDMPNLEHISLFPAFYNQISKEVYGYDFRSESDSDPFYYSSASLEMLTSVAEKAGCDLITTINHGFFKANMAIACTLGEKSYKEYLNALGRGFIASKDLSSIDNYEDLFESLPRSCAHHSLIVMKKKLKRSP